MKNKPVIGIDLGTTYSAIAVLDETGNPTIVPIDGERTMPSCISSPFEEKGKLFVGNEALQDLSTEPANVFRHFKRDMGLNKICQLDSGLRLSAEDASSRVLKKLIQEAEKTLGKIEDVVITVPANFGENQRKSTIAAGKKAGVKVKNIINEPTAAALTLSIQQNVNGKVLIYDLGGGTFDVTIAQVHSKEVECLTSEGDLNLGGIDFDRVLADLADEEHQLKYGCTLRSALGIQDTEGERKSTEWQELLQVCEEMKKSLSKKSRVQAMYRASPKGTLALSVTREVFEHSVQPLIRKTEKLVFTAIHNAGVKPSDIDVVLLVGGCSRMAVVKNSLRYIFGKEPVEIVNPDEAVALGAALYSGIRSSDKSNSDTPILKDVANHFYGIVTFDPVAVEESVSILIEKNTPLPCFVTQEIHTLEHGQTSLECRLTQSESKETNPDRVIVIAEEVVDGLPENRPGGQPLKITYSYDVDQTMHMKIHDVNANQDYFLKALYANELIATHQSSGVSLDELIIE